MWVKNEYFCSSSLPVNLLRRSDRNCQLELLLRWFADSYCFCTILWKMEFFLVVFIWHMDTSWDATQSWSKPVILYWSLLNPRTFRLSVPQLTKQNQLKLSKATEGNPFLMSLGVQFKTVPFLDRSRYRSLSSNRSMTRGFSYIILSSTQTCDLSNFQAGTCFSRCLTG